MKGWGIVLATVLVACAKEKGNPMTGETGAASLPAMSPDTNRTGDDSARGDTTMARDTATGGVWLEMRGPPSLRPGESVNPSHAPQPPPR